MYDLRKYEVKIYSQNGEDGIIQYLFDTINTYNETFVEIGSGKGIECNSRFLKESGWNGYQIDKIYVPNNIQIFVTVEKIKSVFKRLKIPIIFDFLSIDIDGNDYWVLKRILELSYMPRVICIEYNANYALDQEFIIKYDPKFIWKKDKYFGASLSSLTTMCRQFNYELVGTDSTGTNCFFVQSGLMGKFSHG